MLFEKYAIVMCPVCQAKSCNLHEVPADKSIYCPHCGITTGAEQYTLVSQPDNIDKIQSKIRKDIEKNARLLKNLASSIDMPIDEVITLLKS